MEEKCRCSVNCSKDNLVFNILFLSYPIIHELHWISTSSLDRIFLKFLFSLSGEDNDSIKFWSLRFKKESRNIFRTALFNYTGSLMFDNIGRVHLPLPHSGLVHLCLRANKYHPSTIATHVNDLYEISKEESKAACIILSDGGADFSPRKCCEQPILLPTFQRNEVQYPFSICVCSQIVCW